MINWKDIEFKRTSGKEKVPCPKCGPDRKKHKDPCLSVNHEKGVAYCHHCQDHAIREIKPKKEYKQPPQEWTNHTQLSDKVVSWFASRGISQQTLIDCRITEEKHYQPALGKEVNNVVFNYFEGEVLVNKKFRSAQKAFTQISGAKKIFYGLNDIMTEDECYIVEGEMDKLSLWEIGIKNCVSVPNGAGDLEAFETCEQYVRGVNKYYIAVDQDEKGMQLENELIKRLGKHKCAKVNLSGKDPNEVLQKGKLELEEDLKNITYYPVDGVFTAKDLREEMMELYRNGEQQVIQPTGKFFKGLNEIFSFLKGQLTVVTGIPGHGKSNLIEWYVINLIVDLGMKAGFYSPEHLPMQRHQMILAEKVIGKGSQKKSSPRMSEEELNQYIDWSSDKIYLTIPEKSIIPDWDWLFERFEEQIYRYGIDIFVIDAFNKVRLKNGTLFELNEVLARLTLFCQMHNVNVFLIAHPTKMKKKEGTEYYIMPTLYDVKGTGDFYDQTHNGLTVYRVYGDDPFTKVVCTKLKFRHQGEAGQETAMRFNWKNGRYYGMLFEDDEKSLIKTERESYQELIDLAYEEEEVPF